jgi:SAM-dependent methyltransferase
MEEVTRDLTILAETLRVRLLALLEREELGVSELCRVVQLPQSTVSRHLKALQVAGWIRRRAEGTSGLFRLDPEAVGPTRWRLWEVVREAWQATLQADEDVVRLQALLAQRVDSGGFFRRRHAEWDAMRSELFGDSFFTSALAALLPAEWAVADLGCGTGGVLVELAPTLRRVVGVDREPNMVETALSRVAHLPNVEVHVAELEHLPLGSQELDAATCLLVLHHVVQPGVVFSEVRRVLRPGGKLVVVDMVAHDRADYEHTMGHRHLGFDPDALAELAADAGLRAGAVRRLPPAAEAHGPPLFLAVYTRE